MRARLSGLALRSEGAGGGIHTEGAVRERRTRVFSVGL